MTLTQSLDRGTTEVPLIEQTLGAFFDTMAARQPEREALVSVHQGQRLSYARLRDQANQLASALLDLGLQPGDRIGIWSHNNVEWVLMQLATAKVGLVLVNINPAPGTPEGEVVSWADRIAYVCHDFEDAVATGVVTPEMLPALVRDRCGVVRREQLGAFVYGMIDAAKHAGRIGMVAPLAEALAAFRRFNYDNIYLRPASTAQATAVINLLRALVEHYAGEPRLLPDTNDFPAGSDDALHAAVTYVGGMTDRFACRQAVALLDWPLDQLPRGIDTSV